MAGEHTGGSTGGATAATGTRALDAAMTATSAFVPRSGAMAMRASERHIDRMAPEREATRRSRSLATLGFSDRVIGPYVSRAQQSPLRMFGSEEAPAEAGSDSSTEIESSSWIFPRPWYLDELGWLQSTRAGAMATEGRAERSARAAAVRSAAARLAQPASARSGLGTMASTVAPAVTAAPALELIAPSFGRLGQSSGGATASALAAARARGPEVLPVTVAVAATGSATRASAGQPIAVARPAALRAWSPLVPFAAVQAAELMAGVLAPAARLGAASGAAIDTVTGADDAPWQAAPTQELVAPRDLVETRRADTRREPASDRPAPVPEALRNRLQNALRRLEAQRAQTRTQGQARTEAGRSSGQTVPATAAPATAAPGASAGRPETRAAATAASAAAGATAASTSAVPAPTAGAAASASASSRALELVLRSAVAGRTSQDMAPSTGPRLALPAGLGGLIAGMRAERVVSRPASLRASARAAAPAATGASAAGPTARDASAELPLAATTPDPARAGQVSPAAPVIATPDTPGLAHGSAYRAVTRTRPTALAHVAWTDRWLARFAGASTEALTAMELTTGTAASAPMRAAFAAQAPEAVFLSGLLGRDAAAATARAASPATVSAPALAPQAGRAVQAQTAATAARPQPAPAAAARPAARPAGASGSVPAAATLPSAPRIADDDAVSDDVFAAIAAAAARAPRRGAQPARATSAAASSAAQPAPAAAAATASAVAAPDAQALAAQASVTGGASGVAAGVASGIASGVDRLLAASPVAPGPGMRVALASSPVAPALSALLPLPPSPSFDVRAMHGVELARAYLMGLIEPESMGAGTAPARPMMTPLRWAPAGAAPGQDALSAVQASPEFDMPVVARDAASPAPGASPDERRAPAGQQPATSRVPAAAAVTSTAAAAGVSAVSRPGVSAQASLAQALAVAARPAPLLPAPLLPVIAGPAPAAILEPVAGQMSAAAPAVGLAYAPGSTAAKAETWAMAREQHAADLALDYVSPELLVAAQAYGFGPAEAAQAARLSTSGRTGLATLAAAVDLRFIDAFAAVRSGGEGPGARAASMPAAGSTAGRPSISTPGPVSSPASISAASPTFGSTSGPASSAASGRATAPVVAPSVQAGVAGTAAIAPAAAVVASAPTGAATSVSGDVPAAAITVASTTAPGAALASPGWPRAFGLPARTPRGAFLWPHATVMAMNLQAAEADTAQPMSLAALDLLAASAVAQMGALVAPEQAAVQAAAQAAPGKTTPAGASPSAIASGAAGAGAQPMSMGIGTSPGPVLAAGAMSGAGQEASARAAAALRARLASATPLAPDVPSAMASPGSILAAGAPPATYVTPVLDLDHFLGGDLSVRAGASSASAGAAASLVRASASGSSTAASITSSGTSGSAGAGAQDFIADSPAAAAAAIGHGASLPAGFEALYVALSRSPAGRSLSPAVRAARALALVGQVAGPAAVGRTGAPAAGSEPGARARAAAAWAVMPMIFTGGADGAWPGAASSPASASSASGGASPAASFGASFGAPGPRLTGAPGRGAAVMAGAEMPRPERPELQAVAARAGESLQSFVAPSAAPEATAAERASGTAARSQGAVRRAPTAAQPLVTAQSRANAAAVQEMIRSAQQKRSTGDGSIPPWFEEAARRMFQEGSDGGGISLAEMTLVTSAPARLVAASPKSASGSSASARPSSAPTGSEAHDAEPTANVEQIAREVYAEICRMIEMARSRNGDTWR